MKLKSIITGLAGLAVGAMIAVAPAQASEEAGGPPWQGRRSGSGRGVSPARPAGIRRPASRTRKPPGRCWRAASPGRRRSGEPTCTGHGFDNDWEVVPGTATVEVWCEGRRLAGESFTVTG